MSGTLFLVATPIGNLEDITLRALRVLREADVIAAEDTRRTARLLAHYAITTPTVSFHEHNTRARLPQLLTRLQRGDRVALVTDAGTPGVSDPGVELVRRCAERGIAVDPIPGASAPLVAALASGFPTDPLTVFGFVPIRSKARSNWFAVVWATPHTFTFFEAPSRILRTLNEVALFSVVRPIVVARELTKVHQEFIRGTSDAIIGRITDIRGEFTVVVGPSQDHAAAAVSVSDQDVWAEFGRMTTSGLVGRRRVVAELARKYGLSTNVVYGVIERMKEAGA
jgi:16S rRNA (cytidine1402-2'-O)-methyltransferase